MSPRICRLLRAAYDLPAHKRDMQPLQRQLYDEMKTKYTRGTPEVRARMLVNAKAMAETMSQPS